MFEIRRGSDRGVANFGWLDSRHTFSFGHYYDPRFMGFGPLRVINEDRVKPGAGFDTHGHRDMEIISYVVAGALEHKDSTGTGSVIHPGDVQRMTAGTGIRHSEYNGSNQEPVHFLQIWIVPDRAGLAPGYEEKRFSDEERLGQWRLIGSQDGRDGSVTIHQDVNLYGTVLEAGQKLDRQITANRKTWLQVVRGTLELHGVRGESITLSAGDGLAIQENCVLELNSTGLSEVLLFDMSAIA